jgi:hypothetical protein
LKDAHLEGIPYYHFKYEIVMGDTSILFKYLDENISEIEGEMEWNRVLKPLMSEYVEKGNALCASTCMTNSIKEAFAKYAR